ncbi:MAG: hypothetical protein HOY75_28115 [Streptomyces sp.]|nr:hypothetical protein [Streptomyces sp.]
MRDRPKGQVGYNYPEAIAGLANELPAAPLVQEVLRKADRKAVATPDWPRGTEPTRLKYSFAWAPGSRDSIGPEWYPQGISTSYDAYHGPIPGTGANRAVLVSWYAKDENSWKGARITFVDVTVPSRPRYRHVLLVEPKKRLGQPYDFSPVKVHAGGIAWYGDRLYLADKPGHGLRVFNINQMFRVSTSGLAAGYCGYHRGDKKYYAFGYRYVLPQSRAYDNAGRKLTYSQVALDHTTPQPSLLVSEYHKSSGACRVVRWYMNPGTSSITSEEAVAVRAFNRLKVQGAVSVNGRYYFSVSDGTTNRGGLYSSRRGSNTPNWHGYLSIGPEDLSYDDDRDGIWGLGEHPHKRVVYVVGR